MENFSKALYGLLMMFMCCVIIFIFYSNNNINEKTLNSLPPTKILIIDNSIYSFSIVVTKHPNAPKHSKFPYVLCKNNVCRATTNLGEELIFTNSWMLIDNKKSEEQIQ